MNHERRRTLISTDCVGVFGELGRLSQVWPPDLGLREVEMIGWRGRIDRLLKETKERGYTIGHLHGRIGKNRSNPPGWLADAMITPTPKLIQRYGKEYEIVLHALNLNKRNRRILVVNPPKFVWIENCSEGIRGVKTVISLVQELKSNNVQAGMMFDLAHFIGGDYLNGSDFHQYWKQALLCIERILPMNNEQEDLSPLAIHLPVGTNRKDSLPIDSSLSDEMLADLAAILNSGRVNSLVIENKQAGWLMAGIMSKKAVVRQRERNLEVYERLKRAGLVLTSNYLLPLGKK